MRAVDEFIALAVETSPSKAIKVGVATPFLAISSGRPLIGSLARALAASEVALKDKSFACPKREKVSFPPSIFAAFKILESVEAKNHVESG